MQLCCLTVCVCVCVCCAMSHQAAALCLLCEAMSAGAGNEEREQVLDVPPHYFPGACFVCKATPPAGGSLSRCANCRMIKYCSKEHQKMDWPIHKTICKRLERTRSC